jgi:hypothetical protein
LVLRIGVIRVVTFNWASPEPWRVGEWVHGVGVVAPLYNRDGMASGLGGLRGRLRAAFDSHDAVKASVAAKGAIMPMFEWR